MVYALCVSGTNLFAGTGGYVCISTNNGTSWTAVNLGLTYNYVYALAVSGTNLFAGTDVGVFLTSNNGTNWTAVNTGLTNNYITALDVSGTNLFAGNLNGVWMRPLPEMITSVDNKYNNLPTSFSLQQNYPNPFNPATSIKYSIPKSGIVIIKVFDVLGRKISTLVNEYKLAGNYSVQFNAAKSTSGVYFYRMESGSFTQTKKLLILK